MNPLRRSLPVTSCLALLLANAACSSSDPPANPPTGPSMGIIEVRPDDIELGEKAGTSSGGASGTGGSTPIAGTSPVGGYPAFGGSPAAGGSAGRAPAVVFGKACETSADCPSGQTCHLDSTDLIAHKQCAIACDSDAPCKAVEPDAFCIGAHVCVHPCETDLDCGPKTRCGTAGWCERSGPGSGVPYCGGFATPCSLLSGVQCASALGCHDDSDCSGVASSCYSQFDVYSCTSQDGCFWSSSSKNCSGSAHFCSSYSFGSSCESQKGCNWREACGGTPLACETTPVSTCTLQPGCSVMQ